MADPKLVIIIGVGSGLGGAISRRFAAAGHPVAMAARSSIDTDKIAADIQASGGRALAFAIDAEDGTAVASVFDRAETKYGSVGVAIFNVSGRVQKSFLDISAAEMEQTWRSGFLTAFHTGSEAARRMVPRGEGKIFFTGAPASRRGMPNNAPYAAAKFGVRAMAQSMAREFSPQGIHVAHFTLGGGVGNENRTKRDPELASRDGLMSIEALAETYYQTYLQPRSCWAFDVEMRPWNRAF